MLSRFLGRLRAVHRNLREEESLDAKRDAVIQLASDLAIMQGTTGWAKFKQYHKDRFEALQVQLREERDYHSIVRLQAQLTELDQILSYVPAVMQEAAVIQGELEEVDE